MPGDMAGGLTDEPIWYGALYQEVFREPWHLATIGTSATWLDASVIPSLLPAGMQWLSRSTIEDGAVRHAVLVLPPAPTTPPR
jgi:hypothetical protein